MTMKRLNPLSRSYSEIVAGMKNYIKNYIPEITDTSSNNEGILLLELWAAIHDVAHRYLDVQQRECILSLATDMDNIVRIAQDMGYILAGPSGAGTSLKFTASDASGRTIPKYTLCYSSGDKVLPFVTLSKATIPAGSTEVDGVSAVQAEYIENEALGTSSGNFVQTFPLRSSGAIKSSIEVEVDSTSWAVVDRLTDYGPEDEVCEVFYIWDSSTEQLRTLIVFGDGTFGRVPDEGASIVASYLITKGAEGNDVAKGEVNTLTGSLASNTSVVNTTAPSGGSDGESASDLKRKVPELLRTAWSGVTLESIENLAAAVSGVHSATAKMVQNYNLVLSIVPTGGGVPEQSLLDEVYAYVYPRVMYGTVLTVTGFDVATPKLHFVVKLQGRGTEKRAAREAILSELESIFQAASLKVGTGVAPSDVLKSLENINDGELVDFVHPKMFTRIPRITCSDENDEKKKNMLSYTLKAGADYATWIVTAVSLSQYSVSKTTNIGQSYLGAFSDGETFKSSGGEIEITVDSGDTGELPKGTVWYVKTSLYNGPIEVEETELLVLDRNYVTLELYFPDEWEYGKVLNA